MTTTCLRGCSVRHVPARSLGLPTPGSEPEDPMSHKKLAVSLYLAAAVSTFVTPPVLADSRASRGMGRGPGPCMNVATPTERALMRNESNGWPTARNPRSSAYGCGQLLASTRRAHYPRGCPLSTTNVACQMAGMRSYVRGRYGSMSAALAARRRKGWY